MMERIVEPITMDVMRNYQAKKDEKPSETYQRVYEQNLMLYSELLNVVKKSREYTKVTLDKIQNNEV